MLRPVSPLAVPLPWPDSCTAPVWVEPTKAPPLPEDTPLSRSRTTALIRQLLSDLIICVQREGVVLFFPSFPCFLLFSIFNCGEICVKVGRELGG